MSDRFDTLADIPYYVSDDADPTVEIEDVRQSLDEDGDTVDLLGDHLLSATLPIGCKEAYELFCDVEAIPRWVELIRSVRVMSRGAGGRPEQVAFLAQIDRATVGYTLNYYYDDCNYEVSWSSLPGAVTQVQGRARFSPLGDEATLMEYQLSIDMPPEALPGWGEPYFDGHAASAVINDFREHIDRITNRH